MEYHGKDHEDHGPDNGLNSFVHKAGNTAAAGVKAGVKGGSSVAGTAAGTAAMGPWGALLLAALSLRHTLYKVLISAGLLLMVWMTMIVSFPAVMLEEARNKWTEDQGIFGVYNLLSEQIADIVNKGYEEALDQVEGIITDGGYDREMSMEVMENDACITTGYDTGYILAAYSASVEQKDAHTDDMIAKLEAVAGEMFPVTTLEKEKVDLIPVVYRTYEPAEVMVVTGMIPMIAGDGTWQMEYEMTVGTYYKPAGYASSDTQITVPAYRPVTVNVPVYEEERIIGTRSETYYEKQGTKVLKPETIVTKYVQCTIHPFDRSVIPAAFDIDLSEQYDMFPLTYGEVISHMAFTLKKILYGEGAGESGIMLNDTKLQAFMALQMPGQTREKVLKTALCLVGKVPYFWGGKSEAGWNEEWNTLKLVTAPDSPSTGTMCPYGLDCSGFTDWVYKTALGVSIGTGSSAQWRNSIAVTKEQLKPGDLGFLAAPNEAKVNHVLIYAGRDENGRQMWVHCESGTGVVFNSPNYVTQYRRPAVIYME